MKLYKLDIWCLSEIEKDNKDNYKLANPFKDWFLLIYLLTRGTYILNKVQTIKK